jgi:hypothetical protein
MREIVESHVVDLRAVVKMFASNLITQGKLALAPGKPVRLHVSLDGFVASYRAGTSASQCHPFFVSNGHSVLHLHIYIMIESYSRRACFLSSFMTGKIVCTIGFVDAKCPHAKDANVVFAIARAEESLAALKAYMAKVMRPLLAELKSRGIEINGVSHPVQLVLVADQKALASLLQLRGPLSLYWCNWCAIQKHMRAELGTAFAPRSVVELVRLGKMSEELGEVFSKRCDLAKKGLGVMGLSPLLGEEVFDSFDVIVPDVLHLKMRTTERLLAAYVSGLNENTKAAVAAAMAEAGIVGHAWAFNLTYQSDNQLVKVRLTGAQCKKLLQRWRQIITPDLHGKDAAAGRAALLVWEAFEAAWLALDADLDAFDVATATNAIDRLKSAIYANGDIRILNNSMHVLIAHVPHYLALYGAVSPVARPPLPLLGCELALT